MATIDGIRSTNTSFAVDCSSVPHSLHFYDAFQLGAHKSAEVRLAKNICMQFYRQLSSSDPVE